MWSVFFDASPLHHQVPSTPQLCGSRGTVVSGTAFLNTIVTVLSGQGAQRWRAGRCTQASVRPVPPGPEPQGAKARPTPPGAPAGLRGLRPRTGALGPPAWGHTAASISRLGPEIIRTDAVCSSTLSPASILPRLRNLSAGHLERPTFGAAGHGSARSPALRQGRARLRRCGAGRFWREKRCTWIPVVARKGRTGEKRRLVR